jgi:hypothetical protein
MAAGAVRELIPPPRALKSPPSARSFRLMRRQEAPMIRMMWAIALLASALVPTAAQQPRFTFQPVEGGVMRLDSDSGHVSFCTRAGDGYACRSAPDDRAALQEEIDRLKRENERLRLAGPQQPSPGGRFQLPSEEEIDKAMGLFEKMMRRMLRTFKDEPPAQDRL